MVDLLEQLCAVDRVLFVAETLPGVVPSIGTKRDVYEGQICEYDVGRRPRTEWSGQRGPAYRCLPRGVSIFGQSGSFDRDKSAKVVDGLHVFVIHLFAQGQP